MKTAYYTFTAWSGSAMASGFGSGVGGERQTALVRQPEARRGAGSGEKIVDLSAWRAANGERPLEEPEGSCREGCGPAWEGGAQEGPALPAPRPRKSRRAMLAAELVSTLSVVAVAAALILRVLAF